MKPLGRTQSVAPPPLPLQIWRSICGELTRLLVVSAMTLVGVIAFAVAVKPLSEGKVGASSAITFMTLATIPMLQYALPFAGGFAATLAYHRFAADNEGVAAMSGGLSHRAILLPAAVIGLVLALLVGVLSNTVIPRLFHSMERVLTRDAASLILKSVSQGESVALGDRRRAHWEVYAGEALRLPPDPSSDARDHLALEDVLAVEVGRDGVARGSISAKRVDAWFFEDRSQDEPGTAVQLRFAGAVHSGTSEDGAGEVGVSQDEFITRRLRIPGAIRDDPKFLTWSQMDEVASHPEMLGSVEQRRRDLQSRLDALTLVRAVRERSRDEGAAEFERASSSGTGVELLRVISSDLRWVAEGGRWEFAAEDGASRIRIERVIDGGVTLMSAGSIEVRVDSSPEFAGDAPVVRLLMSDVLTAGRANEPGTRRDKVEIGGLRLVGDSGVGALRATRELLAEAVVVQGNPGAGDSRGVADSARDLRRKVRDVRREVMSKRHERLGYAAACFVMVVTGAVIGMRLRDSLPLPVYLWSFLPALAAVITVSAGQGLAHKTGGAGLLLLWGGVVALAVYTVVEYRRLRAH